MSVVVAFEEVGACVKKLTIEVPQPAVEAESGRVIKEFAREVHLPGFRQGKVPKALIRKRFREEINKEVVDRLLPRYWQQAQAEKNLEPLTPPQVEDLTLEDGQPMTFVASVETRPEISSLNLAEFDLPDEDVEASEDDIDGMLTDLRRSRAEWVAVDRPAARGDRVIGKSHEITEGADENAEPMSLDLVLDSERADEELLIALTDATAGKSVEVERKIGEGDEAETKSFRLEIEEVQEETLPEVDEEFLKAYGEYEDAEAFRVVIREQLTSRNRQDLKKRRENALLDQLRDRHPLQLPERVVGQEVQNMLNEYAENLHSQGVDLERANLNWEEMGSQVQPQAEKRVHARLILDAITEDQDIELDEKRFEQFLAEIARQQGQTPLAVRQRLSESGRLEDLRSDLLREQTIRSLLGEEDLEGAADVDDETDSDS